jgi:hypothetical protein
MAKAATARKAAPEPDSAPTKAASRGVKVTYIPLNDHDPHTMLWNGVKFHARVPVVLDPSRHFVIAPLPKEHVLPDGTVQTRHSDGKVSMIELAKANPSFQVEGFPRAKVKTSKRVVPPPGKEWDESNDAELVSDVEWKTGNWTSEQETAELL